MSGGADYELSWPRNLFAAEARAILDLRTWQEPFELLLEEAFRSTKPRDDFRSAPAVVSDPWGSADTFGESQNMFAARLVREIDSLREASDPRPYWLARQRHGEQPSPSTQSQSDGGKDAFAALIAEFARGGYLDQALPHGCPDDQHSVVVDPAMVLAERLDVAYLWPLQPATWNTDLFYGLIEVFHDLVARPRKRSYHSFFDHWHYSGFTLEPAQRLYRWRINRLLAREQVELQLAGDGEDIGRLGHSPQDGHTQLVEQALTTSEPDARGAVNHAVALFRARTASREEKRSACVTLAGLLEQRRDLIKRDLLSKDEGALFEIANRFDLRHRNADQRADYADAYLDWVFWWYLATIALTDRLLAQQASGETNPTATSP